MECQNRESLPIGAIVVDEHERKFYIEKVIGCGGNSIIYEVSNKDTKRQLILKECYPNDTRFTRKNKVVCPIKSDDSDAKKYLNALKENMAHESEIGQKIANTTRRIIGSWENIKSSQIIIANKIYDATDSFFILMEKAPQGVSLQEFLSNTGKPTPYITACIMEQLLEPLSYLHRAGYIHGDIQENNFLLVEMSPERCKVGYGQLLDLGNAREILEDGATAIINEEIFSTPGYCSPEILTGNPKTLRLTQATDIYSVGALMLYLIKGFGFKSVLGQKMALRNYRSSPVTEYEAIRCGYRHKAATFVGKILLKALKQNPKARYQNASEMLEDIRKLKKMVAPPKFKLSPNLSISSDYVEGSRYNDIIRLQNDCNSKNPNFIWGIAGIGKTTLSVAFAKKQIENGIDAYFVQYKGSIKETILSMNFSGYEFWENDEEKDYLQRLNILRENYSGCLLIIDGFDRPNTDISELQQEVAYRELVALDMYIVFTTRSRPDKVTPELKPLSEKNALKLFKTITNDEQAEQKTEVLELLREVNYHPLTVSLAAHTISESWNNITAEFLLSKFKNGNFSDADKVYQQIKILLNLFDLEEYRDLLCHTTLLPLEGFDAGIFIDSESNVKKKQLKKLEGASWIRRQNNNKLSIHPLIRQIFKNELKPKDEDCEEFLSTLWEKFEFRYPQNAELFKQAAELYKNAAENLEDKFGNFNFRAGHCFLIIRKFADAAVYSNKAMRIQEKVLSMWNPKLAPTYNDVGVVSLKFYDESKASKCFMCAYTLCQKVAPNNPYFADAHLNLSEIFAKKSDYDNALLFAKSAIEILKNQPPQLEFKLADAYNEYGHLLKLVCKYEDALKNIEVAAEIYKRISPLAGSPDLAVCYRNIGDMYIIFGDIEKAVEYTERAIQIQEKILPPTHTDLLNSYYKATKIYQITKDTDKFFSYSNKISAICRERQKKQYKDMLLLALHILEVDKNLTLEMRTHRYRDVAESYQKLEDFTNAEKYILLSIEQISLGVEDAIEILLTYFTASQIYREKKNFEVALKYAKDSLSIVEKNFPKDFGNLSMCYMQMGILYSDMKMETESRICFQKSHEFEFMEKATGTQNLSKITDWKHINEI